ncbi:hypothetical protein DPSP01_003957 [Paraphaeosphaeria sporulosa]|uniref:Uncharacterized protein n=1 Tax=Paraphaeosphaeria sporulosa TaxID=1460663 RepID=A0A177C8K7_9PLEO|nr:uncharacterized protein CC84DRAFT_1178580 [Paraphaeosphaeria sporulosa]OAG03040.1 hypothetical protein CC84DRAFT_1178580 [Paraphaeosphaeria sporulosa]
MSAKSPASEKSGRSSDFGQSPKDTINNDDSPWPSDDSNRFSSPENSEKSAEVSNNTGKVYQNHPDTFDQNPGPTKHVSSRKSDEYIADMTAPGREAANQFTFQGSQQQSSGSSSS